MNIIDCMKSSGNMTDRQIKSLESIYKKTLKHFKKKGGTADAAEKASIEVYQKLEKDMAKRHKNAIRQMNVNKLTLDTIAKNLEAKKAEWAAADAKSKISKMFIPDVLLYRPSVNKEFQDILLRTDSMAEAIEFRAKDGMVDALNEYKTSVFGQVTEESRGITNQIFMAAGGAKSITDQKIIKLGKQVRKTLDDLHDMYEAAGGITGKIENWMPQLHNSAAMRAAGKQAWLADIMPKLDWEKITDDYGFNITSSADAATNPEAMAFLDSVWDTLSTDGLNKVAEAGKQGKGGQKGKGSIASRRNHARVLHFKTPELQFEYNATFGSEDLFMSLLNHMQSISRDISIMRNMGPSSESLLNSIDASNALDGGLSGHTKKMYDVMVGRTAMTGSESDAYKILKGTQAYLRAAQLGSAFIPALGDSLWTANIARLSGISGWDTFGKYLGRTNSEEKEMLVYILEANTGNVLRRVMDDGSLFSKGSSKTDKFVNTMQNLSSGVMTASGLGRITQHGKDVITHSFFGKVAANMAESFDKLDPDFQKMLSEWGGITEADWAIIQKSKKTPVDGKNFGFLYPSDIIDKDVAIKYETVVQRLRRTATNEPDIKTKAITTQGLQSGSLPRAMMDSLAMYRSFPITMFNNHIRTSLTRAYLKGGGLGAMADMGAIVALTTLSGAAIMQTKEALRNKTPMDMDNREFWQRAMLQGGALSIFGDFVVADTSRFGQSFTETLAGPMFGAVSDTFKLVRQDAIDAGFRGLLDEGTDAEYATLRNNAVQWGKRYLPAASLWYIRGALSYSMGDSLDQILSGDSYHRRKAREKRLMREQGQDYITK